jgi:hypothetical protein
VTDREAIQAAITRLQRLANHVKLRRETGTQMNVIIEDTFEDMVPGVIEVLRFTLDYYMHNIERFDDPSGALLAKSKTTELAYLILNIKENTND